MLQSAPPPDPHAEDRESCSNPGTMRTHLTRSAAQASASDRCAPMPAVTPSADAQVALCGARATSPAA